MKTPSVLMLGVIQVLLWGAVSDLDAATCPTGHSALVMHYRSYPADLTKCSDAQKVKPWAAIVRMWSPVDDLTVVDQLAVTYPPGITSNWLAGALSGRNVVVLETHGSTNGSAAVQYYPPETIYDYIVNDLAELRSQAGYESADFENVMQVWQGPAP